MARIFPRRFIVGKTDSGSIDVSDWLDGETLTGQTVTSDGLTSVVDSTINGSLVTVRLKGVTSGNSEIHFEYSTATRSRCTKMIAVVIQDC